jgi:hypothetical protein
MKISEQYPSKYLKHVDLGGKPKKLTIAEVLPVMMGLPGEQEQKATMFFEEEKRGLPLNKTNAGVLADALGDDTDLWPGQTVILYPDKASYMGKVHDVIRVRVPKNPGGTSEPPAAASPPPAVDGGGGASATAIDDELPF